MALEGIPVKAYRDSFNTYKTCYNRYINFGEPYLEEFWCIVIKSLVIFL